MKRPWPKPKQQELDLFYGKIQLGEDGQPTRNWEANFLHKFRLPYPMRLAWDRDVVISKIRCHREVAASLMRCLNDVLTHFGSMEALREAGLDLYGGCYAYRCSHGTSNLSLHSYGAALDFCLPPQAEIPPEVVDIFKRDGWAWGGDNKARPEIGHFEAVNRR